MSAWLVMSHPDNCSTNPMDSAEECDTCEQQPATPAAGAALCGAVTLLQFAVPYSLSCC